MTLQKSVDLSCPPLRRRDKAVRLASAGRERVEQPACACERVDVGGAAQPTHVRVATHDARGAARRVEQDGIDVPIPPGGSVGRVGTRCAPSGASGARCRARASGAAHRCQRQHVQVGQFQQVRVLPPGAARHRAAGRGRPCDQQRRGRWRRVRTEASPSAKPGITGRSDDAVSPARPVRAMPAVANAAGVGARAPLIHEPSARRCSSASRIACHCAGQSRCSRSIHQRGWLSAPPGGPGAPGSADRARAGSAEYRIDEAAPPPPQSPPGRPACSRRGGQRPQQAPIAVSRIDRRPGLGSTRRARTACAPPNQRNAW